MRRIEDLPVEVDVAFVEIATVLKAELPVTRAGDAEHARRKESAAQASGG
jgi:hypothetical protein